MKNLVADQDALPRGLRRAASSAAWMLLDVCGIRSALFPDGAITALANKVSIAGLINSLKLDRCTPITFHLSRARRPHTDRGKSGNRCIARKRIPSRYAESRFSSSGACTSMFAGRLNHSDLYQESHHVLLGPFFDELAIRDAMDRDRSRL
jgi:hypothetical protein